MLPLVLAMGALLFATIGYALFSPNAEPSEGPEDDPSS